MSSALKDARWMRALDAAETIDEDFWGELGYRAREMMLTWATRELRDASESEIEHLARRWAEEG